MLAPFLLALALTQTAASPNPLAVYDGTWQVTMGGRTDQLVNHCAGTAEQYSCQQVLNGKAIATVSFERTGPDHYNTRVTQPDGKLASTGQLQTTGDTWLWTGGPGNGPQPSYSKTENRFRDRNHIHFAIYSSSDGQSWKLENEGDEVTDRQLLPMPDEAACIEAKGKTYFGFVSDATGASIPDAIVRVTTASGESSIKTDAKGCFSFPQTKAAFDIEVSSPGFRPAVLRNAVLPAVGVQRFILQVQFRSGPTAVENH